MEILNKNKGKKRIYNRRAILLFFQSNNFILFTWIQSSCQTFIPKIIKASPEFIQPLIYLLSKNIYIHIPLSQRSRSSNFTYQ